MADNKVHLKSIRGDASGVEDALEGVGFGLAPGATLDANPTAVGAAVLAALRSNGAVLITGALEPAVEETVEAEEVAPAPTGSLGQLGMSRNRIQIDESQVVEQVVEAEDDEELPAKGWKRAIFEIEATVDRERREDLPQPVESFAPLVDLLHTAGQSAVLKVGKVRYSLWGWPDLHRNNAKVLAIGWGDPLCEVLALHRFPVLTGTCIEGAHGKLPLASADVAKVCEQVTGRAPKDTSGTLFAIDAEEVYIRRGSTVYSWDGSRERNFGTLKQALATLTLRWSQR